MGTPENHFHVVKAWVIKTSKVSWVSENSLLMNVSIALTSGSEWVIIPFTPGSAVLNNKRDSSGDAGAFYTQEFKAVLPCKNMDLPTALMDYEKELCIVKAELANGKVCLIGNLANAVLFDYEIQTDQEHVLISFTRNSEMGLYFFDTVKPVITITGERIVSINEGDTYTDAGATAVDNISGDISADIVVTGSVNSSIPGEYELIYTVTDEAGNVSLPVTRTVIVEASPLPKVDIYPVTVITSEGAHFKMDVTSQGASPVTSRGFWWRDDEHSTEGSNSPSYGSMSGVFEMDILLLTPGAAFRYKAFATNSYGTSWSDELEATLLTE